MAYTLTVCCRYILKEISQIQRICNLPETYLMDRCHQQYEDKATSRMWYHRVINVCSM